MRFQWLKQYQETEEQILYLQWNLNKSKLELNRWVNGDLADVKLERDSRSALLENKIATLEKEIGFLKNDQQEARTIVESFSGLDNQILKLKYIDCLTLEKIAEKTGFSESYIKKRHAELRKSINFLDDYIINKANLKMKLALQEQRENGSQKVHSNSVFKY